VLLSACNTAAPDGTPGAFGLSGLAKAFVHAGSRALLVSHWAVDSEAGDGPGDRDTIQGRYHGHGHGHDDHGQQHGPRSDH
jgi:hypothetical protein